MVEFQPDTDNRATRVRVVVPDVVQSILQRTYEEQTVAEQPYESQADADELIRLCRIHADRLGLKLHADTAVRDGQRIVRLKMRDKRPYVKRSPFWQHRMSA